MHCASLSAAMLVSSGPDYRRIWKHLGLWLEDFTSNGAHRPKGSATPIKSKQLSLNEGTSAHSGVATPQALDAALSVVVHVPAAIGRATPEYASVETRSSQISRHHKLMPRGQNIRWTLTSALQVTPSNMTAGVFTRQAAAFYTDVSRFGSHPPTSRGLNRFHGQKNGLGGDLTICN